MLPCNRFGLAASLILVMAAASPSRALSLAHFSVPAARIAPAASLHTLGAGVDFGSLSPAQGPDGSAGDSKNAVPAGGLTPDAIPSFLEPMASHLNVHGLGTASEIFDGDPPFTPRGCIAQAWTVAEVLRAWTLISSAKSR